MHFDGWLHATLTTKSSTLCQKHSLIVSSKALLEMLSAKFTDRICAEKCAVWASRTKGSNIWCLIVDKLFGLFDTCRLGFLVLYNVKCSKRLLYIWMKSQQYIFINTHERKIFGLRFNNEYVSSFSFYLFSNTKSYNFLLQNLSLFFAK